MKKTLLFLTLFVPAVIGRTQPAFDGEPYLKFYAKRFPQIQRPYIQEIISGENKWANRLGIGDETDTLLSITHVESPDLNPYDDDNLGVRRSLGFMQTREQYMPNLRAFWKTLGYDLGPNDSVDTQCAFGAAEWYIQLKMAHGSVWFAVRNYNGKGPMAEKYVRGVFKIREKIFGRAHVSGEYHATTIQKVKHWKI